MLMAFNLEGEKLANLIYLPVATNTFIKKKDSGWSGLTDQIFLACIQTMSAMPEVVKYLNQN